MNNTDSELVELAAKAVGIEGEYLKWSSSGAGIIIYDSNGNEEDNLWNPLTNDQDAFRLAVKLKLFIRPLEDYCEVWPFEGFYVESHVRYNNDPYAATRRAIVQAAAKIGTDKQE